MGNSTSSGWEILSNLELYTYRNAVAINCNELVLISRESNTIYKYNCLTDKACTWIQLDAKDEFKYDCVTSFYYEKANCIYIINYNLHSKEDMLIYTFNLMTRECTITDIAFDCGDYNIVGVILNDQYHLVTSRSNTSFNSDFMARYYVLDLNNMNNMKNNQLKEEVRDVLFDGYQELGIVYSGCQESIYLFGDTPRSVVVYSKINDATIPTELIIPDSPKISIKMSRNNVISCNNGKYFLFFNHVSYKKSYNTIYILDVNKWKYKKSKIKCPFNSAAKESEKENHFTYLINIDVLVMTDSILALSKGFIFKYADINVYKCFSGDIFNLINRMTGKECVHLFAKYRNMLNKDFTIKHWRISLDALLCP